MNKRLKTFVTIFLMGMAYAIVYALPFVQYVFYDPMVEGLKATNAQLGVLIGIFGLGNVIGAPIGGWLSDKYNHKKVYILGILGTSAINFAFAFNMNYKFAIFAWLGLAVTALGIYFPSHTKIVRLLGDKDSQGQVFGLAESAAGIGSVLVNSIALFLFSKAAVEVVGLKNAVIGYGIAGVIIAIILWFVIDDPEAVTEDKNKNEEEKIGIKDFLTVLKYPGTWFAGMAIFSTYTLYVSLSYFTPYFTNVLGISVAFSGLLSIVRTYLIRFIGSPLGGYMGDKIKSVTKVLLVTFASAIVIIAVFLKLPVGVNMGIIIALSLLISVCTYVARGNMFAVPAEVKSPEKYAAMTAGITCAIGYSPDLFQFRLFGRWLDNYGNQGYKYIFIYTIAILAVGVISSILTLKFKKKTDVQKRQDVSLNQCDN